MATKAPKFLGPDGVLRENYVFSTDITYRTFTGTMDADTVDMKVSVRGAGFSSDPDLIFFEGTSFTIPNPAAYPEGLQLLPGANSIQVVSVLTNGQETPPGTIEANLSLDRDIQATMIAPSGVFAERMDQTVKITVYGLDDTTITGYNFYASIYPGGGTTGYKRINLQPVTTYDTEEQVSLLGTLTADAQVAVDSNGNRLADPLYYRLTGTQTDTQDTTVQTDFDEQIEVDDTVTRLRTTSYVGSVTLAQKYSFVHDRGATPSSVYPAVPYSEFTAIPNTDLLYYTVTAIYLVNGVEHESAMSPEVAVAPMMVTPSVANLPAVSRQQIVRDLTLSIFRSRPDVDVKPGSYLRDTFIDPFSTEAERVRFVVGFLQVAQSYTTLLAIDDPNNTHTSIAVGQSPYKVALKQAFFLRDNQSVQNLIDNCFDQLAAQRGTTRRTGQRARGEVTFYVTKQPSTTKLIPIGTLLSSGGMRFRTTSAARIVASGAGSIYNPATGRWAAVAYIMAESAGSAGNIAPDQIRVIEPGGPQGVQVTNEARTYGGLDTETNYELAVRADGILSSVDTGTYRGYVQKSQEVAGVRQVNVVDAGHSLMMRDLNLTTGEHDGGKVDVWIRGESLATLTDSFAFSFEVVERGEFEPVGDLSTLRFRATNPNISDANPLIEMLDNPAWDFGFTANSLMLNLTDVTIIPPDGIQLSADYNDPALLHITDDFRGTYRFRTSDQHVFRKQPVESIQSFYTVNTNGSQTVVSPSAYWLVHPSDPLLLGKSNEAGDYLQVIEPLDGTPLPNIPSGDAIAVTGEVHVLLSGPEYLNNLGINKYTVHVWSMDRMTEYRGPFDPSGLSKDYSFLDEEGETPLALVLPTGSRLGTGMQVLVDYEHDENYVVQYTSNSLVSATAAVLDETRHATADVVAKETFAVGVDISSTVVLERNQNTSTMDGAIRSSLGQLFGSLSLGQPVRQADVIRAIDGVLGVSYVVVPLTKMTKSDGAVVVREEIVTSEEGTDWAWIPDMPTNIWTQNGVKFYLLLNELEYQTENGGFYTAGGINDARGVFGNDIPYTLLDNFAPEDRVPSANGEPMKGVANMACIIGNAGISCLRKTVGPAPTYVTTYYTIAETARRILLALPEGTTPSDVKVTVTYMVSGLKLSSTGTVMSENTGVKDIDLGPTEYLVLGNLEFTYDEDVDYAAQVTGRR